MTGIGARTQFLQRMSRGEIPLGVFVSSTDPASSDIMSSAGFDYLVLDGEHGRLGRIEIENHVRAAEAQQVVAFVRILENRPSLIQSTLDVGAHGLVVPHIDTADQAAAAVAASRYAPAGTRGMCPACYAGGYTMRGWPQRSARADSEIMIIPIIESRRAVENVEAIVAVEGIDIVHFGPGDLSADMGIDLNTQADQLMEAWVSVRDAAHRVGKRVLTPSGFAFEGADLLIVEMELMMLHRAASEIVSRHRAEQGASRIPA